MCGFGRFIAGVLAVLIWASAALADCTLPEMRTDQRPDADQGPTEITVSFIVADILGVDDLDQQIEMDFFARMIWEDPRLAGLEGCRFQRALVWVPDLYFYNSSNLRSALVQARDQVVIREDGTVSYRQRFTGNISSYHNLRDFPFDRHQFQIRFGPLNSSTDELVFRIDHEETWISDRLNIEGWTIEGISASTQADPRETDGREVSTGTLLIEAKRNANYYFYRGIVPLAFVVAMSWFIFWVPPSRFEFQIGLGATSMLTTIAFMLAISGALPTLGYLTVLDKMIIWAIFLVFLAMAEALATGLLVLADREPLAARVDRFARIAFPVSLIAGWVLIRFGAP